jgi:hypothetical protein
MFSIEEYNCIAEMFPPITIYRIYEGARKYT